jgi:hypothetical protein
VANNIRDPRKVVTIARKPVCGGCVHDAEPEPRRRATNTKARTYKFMLVDHWLPAFAFRGMTNVQTRDICRAAMADLSLVCGMRFIEDAATPNIRIYFKNEVDHGALGVYAGGGAIWMSRSRTVSIPNAKTCVQHEVCHFLGLRANPAADGWGHCPTKACILNINGIGRAFCDPCRNQLLARFGPLDVRGAGSPTTDAPSVGGPQPTQPTEGGTDAATK